MEVYLDHSATTRCYEKVKEIVVKTMMEDYGNPSSLHRKGVEAEKYLKTGQYTMYDISQLLGFSSLFHFSKTFKDYFGVSPKQYMKINRLK